MAALSRLCRRFYGNPGTLMLLPPLLILIWLAVAAGRPQAATLDLSWPNCERLPSQTFSAGVIGVTGGLDFHPNPCAGDEAAVFASYSVYANSGNPGFPRIKQIGSGPLACRGRALICYSYNYGYQAGLYALKQAELSNLHAAQWWLDVETVNSWTSSVAANREDLIGMIAALGSVKLLVPNIGIYSSPNEWKALVGDWRIRLPLWLGTGDSSAFSAALACAVPSFTGEPVVLTQYTIKSLDYNFRCPAYQASIFL